MTDPIADMLTRIRNAVQAKHARVDVPASTLKSEIARILQVEGYISGYTVVEPTATDGRHHAKQLRLFLKYGPRGEHVISGIERISRPGRRVYYNCGSVKPVLGGLGISILTTSRGVMTGREAAKSGVGGEVLCNVW